LCRLMLDHLGLVNIGTAPGSLHRRLSDFRGYPPSHCCSQPAFNIQALPRHASSPVPSPLGLSKSICLTSLVLDIPRLPPQRVRPSLDCPPYARTHTELSHLWGLCPLERHLGRSPTAVPDRGWHSCSFSELLSPEFLFPRRTVCAWASTAPGAAAQGPWPPLRTAHRRETPGIFPQTLPQIPASPPGTLPPQHAFSLGLTSVRLLLQGLCPKASSILPTRPFKIPILTSIKAPLEFKSFTALERIAAQCPSFIL
jgi:hypothetical protein